MGYYTRYELNYIYADGSVILDCNEKNRLDKVISENLNMINPDYFYIGVESLSDFFEDEMKWYDYDDDMIELSIAFPNLIFILSSEGEENEDIWVSYYHNGDSEKCNAHLVYDKPTKDFAIKAES